MAMGRVWAGPLVLGWILAARAAVQVETDALGNVAAAALRSEDPRCGMWAHHGECVANPRYMLRSCATHCAALGHGVGVAPHGPLPPVEDAIAAAVAKSTVALTPALEKRLAAALNGTFTQACRDEVTNAMIHHAQCFVGEQPFPYQTSVFTSQCPTDRPRRGSPEYEHYNRHGKPPPAGALRLAYVLLVHEKPRQAVRLMEALQEPRHHFVIHVDGKASPSVATELRAYAATHADGNVHVLGDHLRRNVSWGGFEMVRATLAGARFAHAALAFDWLINLSGATYPLQPNGAIAERLASLPSAATSLMEVDPTPARPSPSTWHYYVECDHKLRRIWQLGPPPGLDMHTGSQWFMASRPLVAWLLEDKALVPLYEDYGSHTMVADENFFATMLKNSPYCEFHENDNLVHVQFDQWEHDKAKGDRKADASKCLQPNPNHCGRSPTVNTIEYLPALELATGGKLFARKFDPDLDDAVLDALDVIRKERAERSDGKGGKRGPHFTGVRLEVTHQAGVLLGQADEATMDVSSEATRAATSEASDASAAWCVEVGTEMGKPVSLSRCSHSDRALVEVGPCSTDGSLSLGSRDDANASGPDARYATLTRGRFAQPFCAIKRQGHGVGQGERLCLDLEGEAVVPGTRLIAWGCGAAKWNQLFSFGDGTEDKGGHPGALFIHVPFAAAKDKRLCVEAVPPQINGLSHSQWPRRKPPHASDEGREWRLVAAGCDPGRPLQRFALLPSPRATEEGAWPRREWGALSITDE